MESRAIRRSIASMVDYMKTQSKNKLIEYLLSKNEIDRQTTKEIVKILEDSLQKSFVDSFAEVDRKLREMK